MKYEAGRVRERRRARGGVGEGEMVEMREKKIRNGGERDASYICDLKQPRDAA